MEEKEKTELFFLAQDAYKLSEILHYLIRKEICNGADGLKYLSDISESLSCGTETLLKLVEKMQSEKPTAIEESCDRTVE